MIDFTKIFQLKGLKPKNNGHTNFYECCDLTEKVYLVAALEFTMLLIPASFVQHQTTLRDVYLDIMSVVHAGTRELSRVIVNYFRSISMCQTNQFRAPIPNTR